MRNPEILVAKILTPFLLATAGFVAVRGAIIDAQPETQRARMVEDVVEQYFGSNGCLTGGVYDDGDGMRDNIKITEVGVPTAMVANVEPTQGGFDTLQLMYYGNTKGGRELDAADNVSTAILGGYRCKLPDGM